jgi:hypothetical protein
MVGQSLGWDFRCDEGQWDIKYKDDWKRFTSQVRLRGEEIEWVSITITHDQWRLVNL